MAGSIIQYRASWFVGIGPEGKFLRSSRIEEERRARYGIHRYNSPAMALGNKMTRRIAYFSTIVMFMAFMDGFNFYFPHNEGFFSLTYGEGSTSWDIWHVLKRGILFVVFMYMFKVQYKKWIWWVYVMIFIGIAHFGQLLIYNTLIKL